MIDQRQLTYFLAIAEECSITKAAERLHLPQPYLSSQLKNMESELGIQLAQRNTRKLQLTDAGKRLQYRAGQILELMAVTNRELEAFETGLQGTLTIGAIATSAATLLSRSVQLFHHHYPEVRFEIRNMSTSEILDSLKIGAIELGIIRMPFNSPSFASFNLTSQPMVAVCRNGLPIEKGKIGLKDIAGQPLLVNYRFEPAISAACRAAGFEPNILCKADDTRSILLWCNMGLGMAVIPKDWLHLVPGLQLFHYEIDEPALITSAAVVWLKNHALSAIAGNFIAIFKDEETKHTDRRPG